MNTSIRVIIGAALAILAVGCGSNKNDKAVVETEKSVLVEVAKTVKETVPQTNVFSSTIQANVVNNIASQTGGRIRKINVEIGDYVSKGQILAELDKANLEQLEFRLRNQEVELGRIRQLFEQGGVSQSDYEAAELSYNVSKSSYDNLVENTILRSPVNGVVTARNYDAGDMYTMSQPIFTVQQITPVKLLVAISETDYTKVKKGDKVSVETDALPGKTYTGSIVRLYPTMDAATHTFNAEVQVRNENRELRPGMYTRATVDFGANYNIAVPDQAVVKMQGAATRTVFVLNEDGKSVSAKVVTLGRHFDSKYEILSGLEEGETIVVKGQSSLKAGSKVEVAK